MNIKKTDTRKKKGNNAATRIKLTGLPFEKASDLKKASDELRYEMWKRLEQAKIFNEMSKKDEYKFIQEEFKHGLTCKYGGSKEFLVKVFSEGLGVQIDINKELVKNMPHSEAFVETLIRSMGDTFSKSYYQVKGILPADQLNVDEVMKKLNSLVNSKK